MQIRELTIDEYKDLLARTNTEYPSFITAEQMDYMHAIGNETLILAGYKNGKPVYALTALLRSALKLFHLATTSREWIALVPGLSEEDEKDFIASVRKALKKRRVIFWTVESGVEYHELAPDGSVREEGFHNETYRRHLQEIGFTPRTLWEDGMWMGKQPRFVSILELSREPRDGRYLENAASQELLTWDEIMKKMSGNTRRAIRHGSQPWIRIADEGLAGIPVFLELAKQSGEIHGFETEGYAEKIENYIRAYGDQAHLYIARLDTDMYKDYLNEHRQELLDQIEKAGKRPKKLFSLREELASIEKQLEKAAAITETNIPLAGGFFFDTRYERIYQMSGSNRDYASFHAIYGILGHAIKEALDEGKLRFNFLVISGRFDRNDPTYGVFEFKKNFGARPVEYCGDFSMKLFALAGKLIEKRLEKIGALTAPDPLF